jgi:putative tricarboxylic transport membrane protein
MTATDHVPERVEPAREVDRPQYLFAGFLALVGVVVIADATTLAPAFADQPVQPSTFPYVIGAALLLLAALLVVATARGNRPEAEEGEDVDLTQGADWVTVAKLAGVFLVNVAFVDWLGWAITGALLFGGTAGVLEQRFRVRDFVIGAVLSVGTWYGFYVGLGIPIPAGILDGVL